MRIHRYDTKQGKIRELHNWLKRKININKLRDKHLYIKQLWPATAMRMYVTRPSKTKRRQTDNILNVHQQQAYSAFWLWMTIILQVLYSNISYVSHPVRKLNYVQYTCNYLHISPCHTNSKIGVECSAVLNPAIRTQSQNKDVLFTA